MANRSVVRPDDDLAQAAKSVERARELSAQVRAKPGGAYGRSALGTTPSLLLFLNEGRSRIPAWWSRARDVALDAFWKESDHLSSALSMLVSKAVTVPPRVLPRDASLKRHQKEADEFNVKLVEESEFGQGWITAAGRWLTDFWTQDNGGFFEIIGDTGRGLEHSKKASQLTARQRREMDVVANPIAGPAEGMSNLDSQRCRRTGDPEYPVLYQDVDGALFRYHWSRVAFASDMPSARAEMNDVGFCAISRCVAAAQVLIDANIYYQEKMGSRRRRAIMVAKGVDDEIIIDALKAASEENDYKGFTRYSDIPLIAGIPTDAIIELLDLVSLPDGFDYDMQTRLGMCVVALAFNVPVRWIWPAITTGATKADAMYQHIAGLGGGIGKVLRLWTTLLGGSPEAAKGENNKFLPPYLKLVFDFVDDEQDRIRADIRKTRADTRATDLTAGVITPRVAREQAVEAGDLSLAQFDQIELAEGRLPDGSNVLTLFTSSDSFFQKLLDLGVDDPLAVGEHETSEVVRAIDEAAAKAHDLEVNARSSTEKRKAGQAMAALDALKRMYLKQSGQRVPEATGPAQQAEEGEEKEEKEEKKEAAPLLVAPRPLGTGFEFGGISYGTSAKEVSSVDEKKAEAIKAWLTKNGQRRPLTIAERFKARVRERTGAGQYKRSISGYAHALYLKRIDKSDFLSIMETEIDLGLTQAWTDGTKACGIEPDEWTDDERKALQEQIDEEAFYVPGFADYIVEHRDWKFKRLATRIQEWANRYLAVVSAARTIACKNQKLEWQLNVVRGVKEHCDSCLKLEHQVRRASFWARKDLGPQGGPSGTLPNPFLNCEGWLCGCGLVPTDKPCSRGRLPGLP